MKNKFNLVICIISSIVMISCNQEFTAFTDQDLDSKLVEPEVKADLLTERIKEPTETDKEKMVIVTSHGYTATPYEVKLLLDDLLSRSDNFLSSQVMLDGHGTNVYDFEKTTWTDWQNPLENELVTLRDLGYKRVTVITTSASGALLAELLSRRVFNNIEKVVMISPLLIFSNKLMQAADVIKFFGVYSMPRPVRDENKRRWYTERPASTLVQLKNLTEEVKTKLNRGIELEEKIKTLIIQPTKDTTVDPVSAVLYRQGLKGDVKVSFVDSRYHIPIVPGNSWTESDFKLQEKIYDDVFEFISD